jgi:large subunit ribosomal protein L34e
MVSKAFRRKRVLKRRSPGGNAVRVYKRRLPRGGKCALCGAAIHGAPRVKARLAKTEKRPERAFGGVLCGACVALVVRDRTRLKAGVIAREDVPLARLKWVDCLKR